MTERTAMFPLPSRLTGPKPLPMLMFSERALDSLQVDFRARQVEQTLERLREQCPGWFLTTTRPAARAMTANWLAYMDTCRITDLDAVAALFEFGLIWGGFDDADSAWIREILAGDLPEAEKVGAIFELVDEL